LSSIRGSGIGSLKPASERSAEPKSAPPSADGGDQTGALLASIRNFKTAGTLKTATPIAKTEAPASSPRGGNDLAGLLRTAMETRRTRVDGESSDEDLDGMDSDDDWI
jgi:hypothetical protein